MDQVNHQRVEQDRFDFLKLIYDLADGDPSRLVSWRNRGENLGFEGKKTTELMRFLYQEELIKLEANDMITITQLGADEMGRKLTNPENPTEHFGEGVVTTDSK